ncbi:MAG: transposase [Flavobacteriales bacterium]|nr:transposase [Flavobacteriales bacterium]
MGFNEFEAVQFGDKRLVKRFIKMFNDLATLPESSINQASGSWAEAKSAYRFF